MDGAILMSRRPERSFLSCSFCGKGQREVGKLIAGPTVYVCDKCVGMCIDLYEEDPRAKEIRGLTVVTFLREHLAGRAADSVTVAELVDAYRQLTMPRAAATSAREKLHIAPLTVAEHAEVYIVSERAKVPALDLGSDVVDPKCVRLVPKELCERYNLMPVTRGSGETIIVAAAAPDTLETTNGFDDVKFVTDCPIAVVVAHPRQIKDVIAACFK